MANIFGILSALVLAAAAYFGFANKKALVDQQRVLESEQKRSLTNEKAFEEYKLDLAELKESTKAATEENAELVAQLETQTVTNETLTSEIEDKKSAVENKEKKVAEGNEKLSQFGNLDDLKRNLEQLSTDLATLNGELLQKTGEIKNRQSVVKVLNTENSNLSSVLKQYSSKESNPNLNTRISRVVSDLGFVILGAGDNSGIVRDSILDVRRNGQTIGKLQVTGTEPSTAAADLIPDSFKDGMRPRRGDTVVASSK